MYINASLYVCVLHRLPSLPLRWHCSTLVLFVCVCVGMSECVETLGPPPLSRLNPHHPAVDVTAGRGDPTEARSGFNRVPCCTDPLLTATPPPPYRETFTNTHLSNPVCYTVSHGITIKLKGFIIETSSAPRTASQSFIDVRSRLI